MNVIEINLDDYTTDPNELDEIGKGFQKLSSYANAKAVAIRARLAGNIKQAIRCERLCDDIYSRLPEWAKW